MAPRLSAPRELPQLGVCSVDKVAVKLFLSQFEAARCDETNFGAIKGCLHSLRGILSRNKTLQATNFRTRISNSHKYQLKVTSSTLHRFEPRVQQLLQAFRLFGIVNIEVYYGRIGLRRKSQRAKVLCIPQSTQDAVESRSVQIVHCSGNGSREIR